MAAIPVMTVVKGGQKVKINVSDLATWEAQGYKAEASAPAPAPADVAAAQPVPADMFQAPAKGPGRAKKAK